MNGIKILATIVLFIILILLLIIKLPIYKYNKLGIKYTEAKEYIIAVNSFEQAYSKAPHNRTIKNNLFYAYFNLADEYAKNKNWEKAILFGEKAYFLNNNNKELNKSLSIFCSNYGFRFWKKDSFDKAKEYFYKALQYDKKNWITYVNLGRLLYEQGKIKETINYWTKAVSLNPKLKEVKENLKRLKKESTVEKSFRNEAYGHFEIKYQGNKKENLAWEVVDLLNEAYLRVGSKLQYYPKEPIPVILYTKKDFESITNNPKWVDGLFDGIIRINTLDIEKNKKRLKTLLYHEYTHALLYRKIEKPIPTWINEGLAQYNEPKRYLLDKTEIGILNKHFKNKSLIPFSELDRKFLERKNKERLKLAYIESKLLIKFIDQRYGFSKIQEILDGLSSGKSIDSLLKAVLFLNKEEFEKKWINWVKKTYGIVN